MLDPFLPGQSDAGTSQRKAGLREAGPRPEPELRVKIEFLPASRSETRGTGSGSAVTPTFTWASPDCSGCQRVGMMPTLNQTLRASGIPDMRYINREVRIVEVARKLDLRLDRPSKVHCWHPDRHQHGDRTASVGIRVRKISRSELTVSEIERLEPRPREPASEGDHSSP
jgi:hypothetical protein